MAITQKVILDTSDAIKSANKLEDAVGDLSNELNDISTSADIKVNASSATNEVSNLSNATKRATSEVDNLKSSMKSSTTVIKSYDSVMENAGGSTLDLISATNGAIGGFVGFTRAIIANTAALLANPIGAIAVAITALVSVLFSAVNAFKSTTGGAKEFATALAPFQLIIKNITDPLKDLGAGLTDVLGRFGRFLAVITGNGKELESFTKLKQALATTTEDLELFQSALDLSETQFEKDIYSIEKSIESLEGQLESLSNNELDTAFNEATEGINKSFGEFEDSSEAYVNFLTEQIKAIEGEYTKLSDASFNDFETMKELENRLALVTKQKEDLYNGGLVFNLEDMKRGRELKAEIERINNVLEAYNEKIGEQEGFIATQEEFNRLETARANGIQLTVNELARLSYLEKNRVDTSRMDQETLAFYVDYRDRLATVSEQTRGASETAQDLKDKISQLQGLKASVKVEAEISNIDLDSLLKVDTEKGEGFSIIDAILPSPEDLEERSKAIEDALYIDTSAEDAFIESIVRQNDAAKEYEETWKNIENAVTQSLEYTTPEIQRFGENVVDTFKLMQDEGATTADKMTSVAKATSSGFQAIGSLMNQYYENQMHQGENLTEAQIAENEKLFEQQKKVQIAVATVDMLAGATTAFATAMSLGPILGPIIGGINAAAVIATGVAQINTIKKTQLNSNGSVSGSIADTSQSTYPAVPEFEFDSGLSEGIFNENGNEETQLDTKVYVVESDITNTQNKVKAIESESTF